MTLHQWLTCTDPSAMLAALGDQADERRKQLWADECLRIFRESTGFRYRDIRLQDWREWVEYFSARFRDPISVPRATGCDLIRCLWPPPMMERERCPNCKGLGSIEAMDSICQLAKCKKCNGTGDAPLINPRWRTPLVTDLAGKARGGESKHTVAGGGDYRYAPNTELMPILADALMDAGADNEEVLNHLRCEHHVAGYCWVIDAILNEAKQPITSMR